jgi:hypothetical protein
MRLLTVMNLSEGLVSAFVMDSQLSILSLAAGAVAATAMVAPKVKARLALSRAKHRSLSGHSKMSRTVARLIPFYEFDTNDFFRSDGAPAAVAAQRQDGFFRLASLYKDRFARSRQMTSEAPTASTFSATIFTRNASPAPRSAPRRSARCSASIIPLLLKMCGGSSRFPGSTKSRSTCPAPKR